MSVLFGHSSAHAQSEAVDYMSELFLPFEDIDAKKWNYLKVVTRGRSARKIDKKRQKLINEIQEAKATVRKVRAYQKDTILKSAVKEYLDMTSIILKEDYGKIMDMEEIAEQSYDAMEAYLLAKEKAGEKFDEAAQIVSDAQEAFAVANNIQLLEGEKDKRQKKIENASNLLSYYNDLYLIFFKPYKEEAYVMEALMKNDISSIEQHNNTLLAFAEEGLEKLKDVQAYKGDSKLIFATRTILKFYIEESKNDFTNMVDFYVKQDNFEKIQKRLERKKKKDRTEKDIDAFNNAAEAYNLAADKYNKIISANNTKRDKQFNDYNKAISDFFDKHN